jgi:tetratricopeptide (TPR) repeat protein
MHNALLSLLVALSIGCLWDSDTLRDEALLRPDAWEVVSGQVPAHGEAYYRHRVATITALASPDRTQRNDLAVALIRLGDLVAAERVLVPLHAEQPDEYEALSNLAVLRRNQGRFAEAVPLFERALELHPDGHLGLGDWTLRAVRWQARVAADPALAAREDFLDRERKSSQPFIDEQLSLPWDKLPAEQRDRLQKLTLLLRNYRKFAEGYLVLGDELVEIGDNSLACYAYIRALELQHPDDGLVIDHLLGAASKVERWNGALLGGDVAKRDAQLMAITKGIRADLAECRAWNEAFTAQEDRLVADGREPALEETLAALRAAKIEPHLPMSDADRRAQVHSTWAEGLTLLKQRKFPAAEKELAKAARLADPLMHDDDDRARLLVAYAASLSPQGGKAKLQAAATALVEAERILRAQADPDPETLAMTLGNLVAVHEALGDQEAAANAAQRKAGLAKP